MNIRKILDETETMEMEWEGHKVSFEVRKMNATPELLKNAHSYLDYPKAIASAVTSWDVTCDDDGNMWPLTEEQLSLLPIPFLDEILGKISETWAGDKKKQQNSPNGSEAAAS